MRTLIGVLARLVVLIAFVLIVGHAVYTLADRGEWIFAVVALIASPITVFAWPIFGNGADISGFPLWIVLVALVVAYPISTFIGGLHPISRPRDLFNPETWVPLGEFTHEDAARAIFEMSEMDEQMANYVFEQTAGRYAERADRADPRLDADVNGAATRVEESDPVYGEHLDALVQRWNDLWAGDTNPLKRDESGQPNDIELAIINHISQSTSMTHAFEAQERGGEPDMDRVNRENDVADLVMAGGYLWRQAEQQDGTEAEDLRESISWAVEVTKERLGKDFTPGPGAFRHEGGLRSQLLTWALFQALPIGREARSRDTFWSMARDDYAGSVLEDGCHLIVDFACQWEGLDPNEMLLEEADLRSAFIAGVALREIEPYFPMSV